MEKQTKTKLTHRGVNHIYEYARYTHEDELNDRPCTTVHHVYYESKYHEFNLERLEAIRPIVENYIRQTDILSGKSGYSMAKYSGTMFRWATCVKDAERLMAMGFALKVLLRDFNNETEEEELRYLSSTA